jgi:hypothetical protein
MSPGQLPGRRPVPDAPLYLAPVQAGRVDFVSLRARNWRRKGVEFDGDTVGAGVCHMVSFRDPDGTVMTLHRRYASFPGGLLP